MTIKHLFPTAKPTVNFNFAAERLLDPRITFTRSSTGTYVDEDGILRYAAEDEPRFDHDGGTGESLGLLVEEARTNQITSSTDLGNTGTGGWYTDSNKGGLNQAASRHFFVVEANTPDTLAPDGTQTATKLSPPSIENPQPTPTIGEKFGIHIVSKVTTTGATTDGKIACSFFVKDPSNFADGLDKIGISSGTKYGTKGIASFDLVNNDTNYQDSDIGTPKIEPLANGWYRISFVATTPGVFFFSAWNALDTDLYIWGAQCEEGAFCTSYISTSGAAEDRSPDVANVTGTNFSSWYNPSEWTIVTKFSYQEEGDNLGPYAITDNSSEITPIPNRFNLRINMSDGYVLKPFCQSDDNTVLTGTGGVAPPGEAVETAFAMNLNDSQTAADGVLGTATGPSAYPLNLTKLWIGFSPPSLTYINGHISRFSYYPRRLSDEQLQALTA